MADFLRLIDVNAGGFRLKKGQGILYQINFTSVLPFFNLFKTLFCLILALAQPAISNRGFGTHGLRTLGLRQSSGHLEGFLKVFMWLFLCAFSAPSSSVCSVDTLNSEDSPCSL